MRQPKRDYVQDERELLSDRVRYWETQCMRHQKRADLAEKDLAELRELWLDAVARGGRSD